MSEVKHTKFSSKRLNTNPHQTSASSKCSKDVHKKNKNRKYAKLTLEKKDWAGSICSVCMEPPHNAVLLLCSSYSKGCRPYMCATGHRFSNCLEQYRQAYTKLTSLQCSSETSCEKTLLSCPICRGQVKGWTVVEPARKELNKKKRCCMQDDCTFVGNHKQLRKHVKSDHLLSPLPGEVDPLLQEKWKDLERERERNDVISAITSSDPGAIVLGDFVIEGGFDPWHRVYDDDYDFDGVLHRPQFEVFRGGRGDAHDHSGSNRRRLRFFSSRRQGRFLGLAARRGLV